MKAQACLIFIALFYFVSTKDLPLDVAMDRGGNLSHYRCLRQTYDEMAIWFNISDASIPVNLSQALDNAKNAGLKINVAFYSCRSLTVEQQFLSIVKAIGQTPVQRVFIQPYIQSSTCNWGLYSLSENCLYLQSLLKMLTQKGFKAGVVSGRNLWNFVFGAYTACPQVKDYLLAWIPLNQEQNKLPDFNNYNQIGGWIQPFSKYYAQKLICGRVYFNSFYQK